MQLPWLALSLLLVSCVPAARDALSPEEALLSEAIGAAGGEAALDRARELHWTGEAIVFTGDRRIELGVDSTVAPFDRARSDTWLKAVGPASLRSLELDGDHGWMTRDGRREPMPAATLRTNSRSTRSTA